MKMNLLAVILIIIGLSITFVQAKKYRDPHVILGTIVDVITFTDSYGTGHKQIISYSDKNGQKQNYVWHTYYPPYSKVGDELPLAYNPKSGVVSRFDLAYNLFFDAYILIGIGVLIFGYKIMSFFQFAIFDFLRRRSST